MPLQAEVPEEVHRDRVAGVTTLVVPSVPRNAHGNSEEFIWRCRQPTTSAMGSQWKACVFCCLLCFAWALSEVPLAESACLLAPQLAIAYE